MSAKIVDEIGTMPTLPLLHEGDRLKADEFHRRYAGMPYVKNANLINGVVYMSSPVFYQHGGPHFDVIRWLGTYSFGLRGVEGADNTSWRIDDDNEPQPDVVLFLDADHGGNMWHDRTYLRGVPELAVEVAASSARLDTGEKRNLYERIGVQEYIVWRILDEEIDWWELVDGVFRPVTPDADGVMRSRVFPGLWLNAAAMIDRAHERVKATLDAGLASPEYHAFAARLRQV